MPTIGARPKGQGPKGLRKPKSSARVKKEDDRKVKDPGDTKLFTEKRQRVIRTVHENVRGEKVVQEEVETKRPLHNFRDATAARDFNTDGKAVPLAVMVGNMRFAHGEALDMMMQIAEAMPQVLKEQNPDQWAEILDLFKNMMRMRDVAQRYAVDAAPYMHPKLASVEYKDNNDLLTQIRSITRKVIDGPVSV